MSGVRKVFLIFFSLMVIVPVFGKHIIGGDISYECLGNGRYKFIMKIYRDCRAQQMAAALDGGALDNLGGALISVFRGNGTYASVANFAVPLSKQGFIAAPDFPCLIPPDNLCVEEGQYEFEFEISDWPSTQSYHFVYQRCCRNNTITNIVGPGQSGATYSMEIRPEAQANCNNSPKFAQFPPTVVCVGADINFDHSALDQEGDSLVYSFCRPIKGGGNILTLPRFFECDGGRPNPPCPPPFNLVAFKSPYTVRAPMQGDPVVSIDSATGLITGTPLLIGQFVVGICVKEYRSGVLLSEIKRDFQFNVADCDPAIFAKVKSDATIGQREFVINSCGNNTILFENSSTIERFIDSYLWEFYIQGSIKTSRSKDTEITFPGIGTYRGIMAVNAGTSCADTAEIFVNLYPSITADFSFDYDTCIAGPTFFADGSFTGATRIESWEWSFGEGGASDLSNPTYTYQVAGEHEISLTVTDNNACKATRKQMVRYFPVPSLIVIEPSSFVGCSPAKVFFNNLSVPIDSTYDIVWDFGDGLSGSAISPTHLYESAGVFSVNVDITSPIGCFTSASFQSWIEIKQSPRSRFTFSPDEPSDFNPTVHFANLSQFHISQQWIFDDAGRSQENNPSFTFPDTGVYEVFLIAVHENGCRDTSIQQIDIIPTITYHMPNAFTPNGDGKNDLFGGKGFTDGLRSFEFSIWSRWGERLFVTDDPSELWNGSKDNSGPVLPPGVYVYQVKYVDPRGKEEDYRGFATLIL